MANYVVVSDSRTSVRVGLGEGNDLRGEDQARAESNQKGVSSLMELTACQHPVHGQRDGRCGGVPGGDDGLR